MSGAYLKANDILRIKCTSNIVSECRVTGYYKKEQIGDQIYITEAKDKKAITWYMGGNSSRHREQHIRRLGGRATNTPGEQRLRRRVVLSGIGELGKVCTVQDHMPCLGLCVKQMEDL